VRAKLRIFHNGTQIRKCIGYAETNLSHKPLLAFAFKTNDVQFDENKFREAYSAVCQKFETNLP